MTPEQFCYWLHGFFEIQGSGPLSTMQSKIIEDHLDLVFNKVTPDRSKKPQLLKEEKTDGQKFQDVIDELRKQKVDPFDRPDVYCAPEVHDEFKIGVIPGKGKPRIC